MLFLRVGARPGIQQRLVFLVCHYGPWKGGLRFERGLVGVRMNGDLETRAAKELLRAGVGSKDRIVVALSGGPDSVALLEVLLRLANRFRYELLAAHLNHGLRGAESSRDEAFVRDLCREMRLELVVEALGTGALKGGNLEERAREIRMQFLARVAQTHGATRIALGHHADDQAETVLMRLLRGAGVAGLSAMRPCGPGAIIRPLLGVSRSEILKYLECRRLQFVEDSSNRAPFALRNRLRTELLPYLEVNFAPGLRRRLSELAAEMQEIEDFLAAAAEAELERRCGGEEGSLWIEGFANLPRALGMAVLRRFVGRAVGLRRLARSHWMALYKLVTEGPPNGTLSLPGRIQARRVYGRLRLEPCGMFPKATAPFRLPLALTGATDVPGGVMRFEAAPEYPPFDPVRSRYEALFALDNCAEPLEIRSFQPGDRVAPLGLGGTRKVKDVFIDSRVPRPLRARFPLVVQGDAVLWVPGFVRGRVALVAENTAAAVRVRAIPLLPITELAC